MLGEHLQETLDLLQVDLEASQSSDSQDFAAENREANAGAPSTEKRVTGLRKIENIAVSLRPSNLSQRQLEYIEGVCRNFSYSGCGMITSNAPRVGDLYQVSVPGAPQHVLHSQNARCVRCHLLDEESFDCGFSFLTPLRTLTSQASPDISLDTPIE